MVQLDENQNCNLCGSPDRDIIIDGQFGKVAKCGQCGLMFRTTSIRDTAEQSGGRARFAVQYEAKQRNQLADYETCFSVIDKYPLPPDPHMLEIGSHTGHFLNLARKRGWRVKGVEPNAELSHRAMEQFDLDVAISFLRDAQLPENEFDAVVLFHVIEHFFDPLAELREMHRVMRPGGILVAETPRYDTIFFKLLKERERSVIPNHYFYFTRRSLTDMVTKAGFTVLRLDSVGRTLSLDRLHFNVSKMLGSKSANRLFLRLSDSLHFDRIKIHLNMHDMMRIYARKNE